MALTPEERTLRARAAANARWAKYDSQKHAAKMRQAGPAGMERWLAAVDPGGELPEAERMRRAQAAKRSYFQRLSLRSARARRERSQT